MVKVSLNMPSERDLRKMLMAAVEEKITQAARRAALPHGGVRIHFSHKPDGSLASVGFEGTEEAVQAAQDATHSL